MDRKIYGVIHLAPLPGTPYSEIPLKAISTLAVRSATALRRGGASGCLIQTADRVYATSGAGDPARIAALTIVVSAVVASAEPPFEVGVQVMRNEIESALAVAKIAGAHFARVVGLVGTTDSESGPITADPYKAIQYRHRIDARDIRIVTDAASIHHRDPHPVGELARWSQRVGADAVAVGVPSDFETMALIDEVRAEAPGFPVYLAGHTRHDNAATLLVQADGAFVGRCFESSGWGSEIDEHRVAEYMEIVRDLPPPRPA